MGLGKRADRFTGNPLDDMFKSTAENPPPDAAPKEPVRLKSFILPVSLHKRLKERAAALDTTMTSIVCQALEEWLKQHPK